MPVSIDQFLPALGVASKVHSTTGLVIEGAKAGGFAAWVQSLTGSPPYAQPIEGTNRVRIILNENQVKIMQDWLDSVVVGSFEKKAPPPVEYDLGPVLKPWAMKRVAPVGAGILVVGILSGFFLARMI